MSSTLIEVVQSRRTIHHFQPEVPPESILQRAIEAAVTAPNHRLTEPWRFYIIGPETAQAIVDRNADLVEIKSGPEAARNKRERWSTMPGWFAVTCQRSDDPFRQREDYAACACAIQNLMLVLWSEGVGTKWGTGDVTHDAQFFELLGLDPQAEFVVGLFWYGYPAEIPQMTRKKSVDDVTIFVP